MAGLPTVHAHWSIPMVRRFSGCSAQSACFDVTYKTRIPPFLLLPFYFVALVFFPFPSPLKPLNNCGHRESTTALHSSLAPCSPCVSGFAAFLSRRTPSGSPSQVLHSLYTALQSLLLVISFWRSSSAWITRYTSRFPRPFLSLSSVRLTISQNPNPTSSLSTLLPKFSRWPTISLTSFSRARGGPHTPRHWGPLIPFGHAESSASVHRHPQSESWKSVTRSTAYIDPRSLYHYFGRFAAYVALPGSWAEPV
ncbi:hypothetical protein P152DRAFT_153747 [Eremomyces bilateralis CBS 781.70]|uniref:Uncharacterized protein n=1 Tax=Eremomyces bilateralis CBS 781.70 TaxID=1392243 RepID=A0A6G1FV66_9PEZI|nr:uncharacterized protein P152DRAFT_153747 [Eremomyces bilateralis CBS 781.70]KAF1809598.1 hypothetical protein P152DRAFT_153747 [Eremomyces bilateralis CBS 781.70]